MRACEEESMVTSAGELDPAKGTKRKKRKTHGLPSTNSSLEEKDLSNVSKGTDMNLNRKQIVECTVFSKNIVEVSKENNNSDYLCKTVELDPTNGRKMKKTKKNSSSSKNSHDTMEEEDLSNLSNGPNMTLKEEQIKQHNVFLKNNMEVSKESILQSSLQTTEIVLNKKHEGHSDPSSEESVARLLLSFKSLSTTLQESGNYVKVRKQQKKKKGKKSSNVAKNSDPAEKLLEEQTGMKPLEEENVDSLEGHDAPIEESLTLESLVNEQSNTVLHESENHAETTTRQKKKKKLKKNSNVARNSDPAEKLLEEQTGVKPLEEENVDSLEGHGAPIEESLTLESVVNEQANIILHESENNVETTTRKKKKKKPKVSSNVSKNSDPAKKLLEEQTGMKPLEEENVDFLEGHDAHIKERLTVESLVNEKSNTILHESENHAETTTRQKKKSKKSSNVSKISDQAEKLLEEQTGKKPLEEENVDSLGGHGTPVEESLALESLANEMSNTLLHEFENHAETSSQQKKKKKLKKSSNVSKISDPAEKLLKEQTGMKPLEEENVDSLEGHGAPLEESLALESLANEMSNTLLHEFENHAEISTRQKKKKKSKKSSNVSKISDPAEKLLEEQTGMKSLEEENADSLEGRGAPIEESLTLESLVIEQSNAVLHESENHAETSTHLKKKRRSKNKPNVFKNGDAAQELPMEQIDTKSPEEEFSVSLLKNFELDLTMVKRNNESVICNNLTPVVEKKHSGCIISLPAVQNRSMCGISPNCADMGPPSRKVGGRIRKKVDKTLNDKSTSDLHDHTVQKNEELNKVSKAVQRYGCEDENFEGSASGCEKEETMLSSSTKNLTSVKSLDLIKEVNNPFGNRFDKDPASGKGNRRTILEDDSFNNVVPCDLPLHAVKKNENDLQEIKLAVQKDDVCGEGNFELSLINRIKDERMFSLSTGDAIDVAPLDLINKQDNLMEMELMSLERAPSICTKKKLLVLDLNGLLADIVFIVPHGYKADFKVANKHVFKRPFCDDFLKFCFERFDIGIWSSRTKSNVDTVVDYLFRDMKHKLLFCWDSSRCTQTGFFTLDNRHKPLVFKELNKLWNKDGQDLPWEKGEYSMSNTLLLDDSPYKALCNPPHTAIFPHPYTFKDTNDDSLGPGGDLRVYIEKLAMAEDIQLYVQEHPFGQRPITAENPSWNYYLRVINSSVPT